MLRMIKNAIQSAADRWGISYQYDQLPPEKIRLAATLPVVRDALVKFSLEEYDRNPYYQLVIENLTNHTVGPSPSIIAIAQNVKDKVNDSVEDAYSDWVSNNKIGSAYREIRRQAALTGIGIGIPFKDEISAIDVKTAYKIYGGDCLANPHDAVPSDRIFHGIEYDANWEPRAFHVRDQDSILLPNYNHTTKEYRVEEVIYWSRGRRKGMLWPLPECYAAFTFYPFIRRFLQAVIQGEEFLSSMPMAIELDPQVYSTYAQSQSKQEPMGQFVYEPNMIPTLRPGMKLAGIPISRTAGDREKTLQVFACTCALTVQMPKNLALGDSSNSNMASAQVDIQPWANKVNIDRFDMEPMYRKSFKDWWAIAVRRQMTVDIMRKYISLYPHVYVYPDLFEHPDPNKRASARATDLASGATTLNRLYSNLGLNFRREIEREAQTLGITTEELIHILISSRSTNALSVLEENQKHAEQDSSSV